MTPLVVELGPRSYPIHVTTELPGDLVGRSADAFRQSRPARTAVVVTDTHVGPLYAADVVRSLESVGLSAPVFEIEAGERSKTLDTARAIVDFALARSVGRSDLLVGLGGGVVGDVTGFVASVLHRGIGYLQVPTSLLAQVDAAVGGKTAVNHRRGKNLIGSFWQPIGVVSSQRVLETLDPREVRSGLAEALKHGLVASGDLVVWIREKAPALVALDPEATGELVRRCCGIKAAVVSADERDEGRRAVLNYGHTLGHAYERLGGFGGMRHGEAVALGMVWAARLSEALGTAEPGTVVNPTEACLEALGLVADTQNPGLPTLAELVDAASADKKAAGDRVAFVLLSAVGRPLIRNLGWRDIINALGGMPRANQEEGA